MGAGRRNGAYLDLSRQVTDETAAGLMAVEARMDRTSRWSCRTMTRGNIWYSVGAARRGVARDWRESIRVRLRESIVAVECVYRTVMMPDMSSS